MARAQREAAACPHAEDWSGAFRTFRRTRDRRLRNDLVEAHEWLAHVAARRFAHRGEPMDDLLQVALLGVLKAVERFDPDFGASFVTFAMPTVTGELRRHFRDATWAVRVPRRAKELHLTLNGAMEALYQKLGHAPSVDEISAEMGISCDEVLEAMEAGNAYRTGPLASRASEEGSEDENKAVVFHDEWLGQTDARVALYDVLDRLPDRERQILYLRFFGDHTQTEIADIIGVSQVHVSRLLRTSMASLRRRLGEDVAR
jgi:RNA polymerase sigma-B factor